MKTIYFTENTIVAFHVGRGGRFYNGGHTTFIGEHKIGDFIEDLFSPILPDPENEDNCIDNDDPSAEWTDGCGNSTGLTNEMVDSGIGTIDIDGDYNTTYTMYLKDVEEDSKEWKAIFAAYNFDAEQAQMYLRKELAIETAEELATYINEHEDWETAVGDVIKRNNWEDLTGEEYDVCEDNDWHRVTLDENGKAIVIDID